jgi:hypothetical protein
MGYFKNLEIEAQDLIEEREHLKKAIEGYNMLADMLMVNPLPTTLDYWAELGVHNKEQLEEYLDVHCGAEVM